MSAPQPRSSLFASDLARAALHSLLIAGPLVALFDKDVAEVWLVAVVVLFVADSGWRRDFAWARQEWMIAALVFWAWLVFVSVLAQWKYEALHYAIPWIRFPLFAAALAYWLGRDDRLRRRVFEAMLAGVALMAAAIVVERIQNPDVVHLHGLFSRPRPGWYLLGIGLPWCMWALHCMRDKRHLPWAAPLVLIVIGATVTTGEVYISLSLVFALAIYVIAARLWTWPIVLAGVGGLCAVAVALGTSDKLLVRFTTEAIERLPWLPQSDYYAPWFTAVEIGLRNPIAGTGVETFREACTVLLEAGQINVGRCHHHGHNIYLQTFAEAGVPGVILLTIMAGMLLYHVGRDYSWARPTAEASAALAIVVMVFWPVSTYSSAFSQQRNFYSWALVGCALVCVELLRRRRCTGGTGSDG